jgi:hypothetical protein
MRLAQAEIESAGAAPPGDGAIAKATGARERLERIATSLEGDPSKTAEALREDARTLRADASRLLDRLHGR